MYDNVCNCRQQSHDTRELDRLHEAAVTFVQSLETYMPCKNKTTGLSSHCTTKVHSVLHIAEMIALAGNCRNFSTSPCELAHKPIVKHKQRLTNNRRKTLGLSLLKTNRRGVLARKLCQTMSGKTVVTV